MLQMSEKFIQSEIKAESKDFSALIFMMKLHSEK